MSRQALIAIEAGNQVPSTVLALRIARELGCAVEAVFSLADDAHVDAQTPGPLASGTRVVLAYVQGRWAAHAADDPAQAGDGVVVDAAPDGSRVRPLDRLHELQEQVLVAGCAPLIGLLAGHASRRRVDVRARWIAANSGGAMELLQRGLVHVAGVHLVDATSPRGHRDLVAQRFAQRATVINLTQWTQGLAVAKGNPHGISGLEDVLRPDVRFVGREPGSGARRLVERYMEATGHPPHSWAAARVAAGHTETAQLIHWDVADVGVTIEAAARACDLDFIPIAAERFDLIVTDSHLGNPAVTQLLESIERPEFRAEAGSLPGYDLSLAGHAVTVTPSVSA